MDDSQKELKEISIMKATFADNDALLKTIRALFLGLGVTDEEKLLIRKTFAGNGDLLAIMHKKFLPSLNKDTEIGKIADVWLGVEQMISDKSPDTIKQMIGYKDVAIGMVRTSLTLLENPDLPAIKLEYTGTMYPADYLGIELMARNQFIRLVETQLTFIKMIAGAKTETPEQAVKRIHSDSSK